jgi:precorrin-6B methylase 2
MRRVVFVIGIILALTRPSAGQQTSLTDAQIKTAEIEIPELARLLELRPGMTVADVGAGFGAWTVRFGRLVGPSGRVYATDIGAAQISALRDYAAREGLTNVTVIEGAVNATNLPAGCCDAILVRDAYHHLTQPQDIVRSLAAALKPGGRLAVIDFPPRPNTEVPAGVPENRRGHGVPPDVVQSEVGAALDHVRTIASWAPTSQPASLYLLLFRKP